MELQKVVAVVPLAVGQEAADTYSSVAVAALAQRLVGQKAGTEHSSGVVVASLAAVDRQTADVAVDRPAVLVFDSDREVAT